MTYPLRAFRFAEKPWPTSCGRCEESLYDGDWVVREDDDRCHAECSEGENEVRYPEDRAA